MITIFLLMMMQMIENCFDLQSTLFQPNIKYLRRWMEKTRSSLCLKMILLFLM